MSGKSTIPLPEPEQYRLFILRVWQDASDGPLRYMLKASDDHRRHVFADAQSLAAFLEQDTLRVRERSGQRERTVLTPQEAIGDLQDDIQTLVDDGVLKLGQANGLTKPLDNAIRSLDKGQTADACNQLADFVDEVNAKTPDPLDGATAADLIADAEAIQVAIGC